MRDQQGSHVCLGIKRDSIHYSETVQGLSSPLTTEMAVLQNSSITEILGHISSNLSPIEKLLNLAKDEINEPLFEGSERLI